MGQIEFCARVTFDIKYQFCRFVHANILWQSRHVFIELNTITHAEFLIKKIVCFQTTFAGKTYSEMKTKKN